MLGLTVKIEDKTGNVEKAADKAAFRNFGHAAASISKSAKQSIETSPEPSAPGQPPHTRKGGPIRRAIRYAADKEGAVIGPMASVVGEAAAAHEKGGEFRGQRFPERPFMLPALERAIPRFAADWTGSVVE